MERKISYGQCCELEVIIRRSLCSKQKKRWLQGRKDHIGTRQDSADLYVFPIVNDERTDDVVLGECTATNSNHNDALGIYLAIHFIHSKPWEEAGGRLTYNFYLLFLAMIWHEL